MVEKLGPRCGFQVRVPGVGPSSCILQSSGLTGWNPPLSRPLSYQCLELNGSLVPLFVAWFRASQAGELSAGRQGQGRLCGTLEAVGGGPRGRWLTGAPSSVRQWWALKPALFCLPLPL